MLESSSNAGLYVPSAHRDVSSGIGNEMHSPGAKRHNNREILKETPDSTADAHNANRKTSLDQTFVRTLLETIISYNLDCS